MNPIRTLVMGAAGRDFHNFNVCFRDNPRYRVLAFTAAQIPHIAGRTYPAELAGPLYPHGIPIHPEAALERLVRSGEITLGEAVEKDDSDAEDENDGSDGHSAEDDEEEAGG